MTDDKNTAPRSGGWWGRLFTSILAGLLGATLALLLFVAVAPHWGIWYVTDKMPFTRVSVYSITRGVPDHAEEALWRLALRDMAEEESQRVEERLHDHFTLLLTLAGMGTAIVLAVFSFTQSRREERALEELREQKREAADLRKDAISLLDTMRREAEEKLREIRECAEKSHTLSSLFESVIALNNHNTKLGVVTHNFEGDVLQPPKKFDVEVPHNSVSSEEFEKCLTRAEKGEVATQVKLGFMYLEGKKVVKDEKQAAYWFEQAASKENTLGLINLGILYLNGKGVKLNTKEAEKLFKKAGEKGDPRGYVYLGTVYANMGGEEEEEEEEAVKYFRKASDMGDVLGKVYLGSMYANGNGVNKNEEEAVKLFQEAADQGNDKGQLYLAIMYANGKGVKKDEKEASRWFLAAASQGNPQAIFQMANRYFNGNGVPENFEEAYAYLLLYQAIKDSSVDDKLIQTLCEAFRESLSPEQLAEAQLKAGEYWESIQR